MFRFALMQRVIFGPTDETAVVVARQDRPDGTRKYLVQRIVDGNPVETLADESTLEEITTASAPAPAA